LFVRIALRESSQSKAHPLSHHPRTLGVMILGASVPLDVVGVLALLATMH
jgi:hypothetical protein